MRPRCTGRSTVCQDARTDSGLRTRARHEKDSPNRGRSAANSALCLMSRVKRGDSGLSIASSPHSPLSRRRPAPVWRDAVRLSSSRPPTCTEGARRSARIRALACSAKSPMRAQAPRGVSIPPNALRRMGSDSATVSGRLPASRQHSEVPERGTPLNSQVRGISRLIGAFPTGRTSQSRSPAAPGGRNSLRRCADSAPKVRPSRPDAPGPPSRGRRAASRASSRTVQPSERSRTTSPAAGVSATDW